MDSCFDLVAIFGFRFGLYHVVAPLSFLRSISLASLFAIESLYIAIGLLESTQKECVNFCVSPYEKNSVEW